jgi:hypothetical protein
MASSTPRQDRARPASRGLTGSLMMWLVEKDYYWPFVTATLHDKTLCFISANFGADVLLRCDSAE